MINVYLAGPDVFYLDSKDRRNKLLKLCKENDLVGIYPDDNDINPPVAHIIRKANGVVKVKRYLRVK